VLSTWKCNFSQFQDAPVAIMEQCAHECAAMKSTLLLENSGSAVMLTCNTLKGNCTCVTFKPLTETEKNERMKAQIPPLPTKAPRRPCRGEACLIQHPSSLKPLNMERPVLKFIFCGPSSLLGFTKCRDICRFEKRGVIRCAGHSCYCHFGGVPFPNSNTQAEKSSRRFPPPFQSRFTSCGETRAECGRPCEYIGDVVCGRFGCYCDSGL